jgi:hypothetical protein
MHSQPPSSHFNSLAPAQLHVLLDGNRVHTPDSPRSLVKDFEIPQ